MDDDKCLTCVVLRASTPLIVSAVVAKEEPRLHIPWRRERQGVSAIRGAHPSAQLIFVECARRISCYAWVHPILRIEQHWDVPTEAHARKERRAQACLLCDLARNDRPQLLIVAD